MINKQGILAVDAGGTYFKFAVLSKQGELLTEVEKYPVDSNGDIETILSTYRAIHEKLKKDFLLTGVGISTPGPFDCKNGVSFMKHKFSSLYGVKLKEKLQEIFGEATSIWFCSDSNAFLAGEVFWGEYTQEQNVIGITIGTGLGFSVIENGKLIMTSTGGPAERIFNVPYENGILEDYVSGKGCVSIYKSFGEEHYSTAKELAENASHDELARKAFEKLGTALGEGLIPYVRKYHTKTVILGGQVSNAYSYIQKTLQEVLSKENCLAKKAGNIDQSALKGILQFQNQDGV